MFYTNAKQTVCFVNLPLARFLLRHADADLMNMLTTSVPPADLGMIQVFKSQLAKWTQKAGCHSWVSLKTIGPSKSFDFLCALNRAPPAHRKKMQK